jgi:hypothetical protein
VRISGLTREAGPGGQIVLKLSVEGFSIDRHAYCGKELGHLSTAADITARLAIYPHPVLDEFKVGAAAWTAIFSDCDFRRLSEPRATMNDH